MYSICIIYSLGVPNRIYFTLHGKNKLRLKNLESKLAEFRAQIRLRQMIYFLCKVIPAGSCVGQKRVKLYAKGDIDKTLLNIQVRQNFQQCPNFMNANFK